MHTGQFRSLTETIIHYSEMDDVPAQGHLEDFLVPLDWTEEDIEAVISFLMLFSEEGSHSVVCTEEPIRDRIEHSINCE